MRTARSSGRPGGCLHQAPPSRSRQPPGTRHPPPVDRHTPVNILPCPKLLLREVKRIHLFSSKYSEKPLRNTLINVRTSERQHWETDLFKTTTTSGSSFQHPRRKQRSYLQLELPQNRLIFFDLTANLLILFLAAFDPFYTFLLSLLSD